jgi:hypothetical protein
MTAQIESIQEAGIMAARLQDRTAWMLAVRELLIGNFHFGVQTISETTDETTWQIRGPSGLKFSIIVRPVEE